MESTRLKRCPDRLQPLRSGENEASVMGEGGTIIYDNDDELFSTPVNDSGAEAFRLLENSPIAR